MKKGCSRFSWYIRSNSYRRPARTRETSLADWTKVLTYLCSGPRRILQIGIGRHVWRHPPRFQGVSDDSSRNRGGNELVATFIDTRADCREEPNTRQTAGSDLPTSSTTYPRNSPSVRKRSKYPNNSPSIEEIINLTLQTCTCPIEKVFRIGVWVENTRYRMLCPSDRSIKNLFI